MDEVPVSSVYAEYRGRRVQIIFSGDGWVALRADPGSDAPDGFESGESSVGLGQHQPWVKLPRSAVDGIVTHRVSGMIGGQTVSLISRLPDGRILVDFIGPTAAARALGLEGDQYMGWTGLFDPQEFTDIRVEETRRAALAAKASRVMNMTELATALADLGIPADVLALGRRADYSWCIEQAADGAWEVFWYERGDKNGLIRFPTERDACFDLLGRLAHSQSLVGTIGVTSSEARQTTRSGPIGAMESTDARIGGADLSVAIVEAISHTAVPHVDKERLVAVYGQELGATVAADVMALVREAIATPIEWGDMTLRQGVNDAMTRFRGQHPDLSVEALREIGRCVVWNWR